MTVHDPFDRALEAFAEGKDIDWVELAAAVKAPADRQRLEQLRVLSKIRALDASAASSHGASSTNVTEIVARPALPQTAVAVWGRYELLEAVGAGSFGRVYRARDPNLDRIVAIKILHHGTGDPTIRERLLLEGKQLAKLRDPNVVSVFDVEEHDGQLGLCMEFVHGETLDDILRSRGTLNHREATLVAQDVCRALAAAHAAGLVHRDVKARNIMRDRAGRIVLMDFGAGREVEELERSARAGGLVGTPLYMAPELLAGDQASFRSDVYSVGVLLYYLVTGAYPVSGKTLNELRAAHQAGLRVPITHRRTDLPPEFVGIVQRALAADPEQRYRSAPEMLDDLGLLHVRNIAASEPNLLLRVGAAVTAAAVSLPVLGFVITQYTTTTLGSSAYADANLLLWARWGAKSLVVPAWFVTCTIVGAAFIGAFRKMLCGVYPGVRATERRAVEWIHRRGLDDAEQLALAGVMLSVALIALTCIRFSNLLNALAIYPDVSQASFEQLRWLSPAMAGEHRAYRDAFTVVTIASIVLWRLPLYAAARRQQRISSLIAGAGAAVTVISILLLTFPYVFLTQNLNEFVIALARWSGTRCYILGERKEDALLFCPARESRLVVVGAGEAQRIAERPDNPFTYFAAPHAQ